MTIRIGLTGKYGSGKTTVAQAIQFLIGHKYQVQINSFAHALKEIAFSLGWDGVKDEKGRRLLQVLGTECAREYDPDIWVKKAQEKETGEIVIYDDVRYNNEAEFIREGTGFIIEIRDAIIRDQSVLSHKSEQGISELYIDHTITNDFNILNTVAAIKNILLKYDFKTLK